MPIALRSAFGAYAYCPTALRPLTLPDGLFKYTTKCMKHEKTIFNNSQKEYYRYVKD